MKRDSSVDEKHRAVTCFVDPEPLVVVSLVLSAIGTLGSVAGLLRAKRSERLRAAEASFQQQQLSRRIGVLLDRLFHDIGVLKGQFERFRVLLQRSPGFQSRTPYRYGEIRLLVPHESSDDLAEVLSRTQAVMLRMHEHCDEIGRLIVDARIPVHDRLANSVESFLSLINQTLDAGALNYEQALELNARIIDVGARLTIELGNSLGDNAQSAQAGSAP